MSAKHTHITLDIRYVDEKNLIKEDRERIMSARSRLANHVGKIILKKLTATNAEKQPN